MPHRDDPQELLAGLPFFARLSRDGLAGLARASHVEKLPRGATLFRVGDPARVLYVLLRGHLKRAASCAEGNEIVIEVLSPGQVFGEAELFAQGAHASFAVAAEAAHVLCVGGEAVLRALAREPGFATGFLANLVQRQFDMERDFVAGQLRSGCQRLLDYFLLLAGSELAPSGETTLSLAYSKQLIASRLGIAPETLSRYLRELSEAGLIVVRGREVLLQNARIARRLAGEAGVHQPVPRECRNRRRGDAPPGLAARPAWSAVNQAGRQRMLTQRMAKSWLMLGCDMQSGEARGMLEQSVAAFERQLGEGVPMSAGAGLRAAREALERAWRPYRAALMKPADPARTRELLELSETVLAAAQRLTEAVESESGNPACRLVNLAGRERMLVQRIAMFCLFEQAGLDAGRCRGEIARAAKEFSAALAELAAAPECTPAISLALLQVSRHWTPLQSEFAGRGASGARQAVRLVAASERMQKVLDDAIGLYELEAGRRSAVAVGTRPA